jgi:D-glycero-D-manno-heptose 1,7-bisphosphate phosphatase
MDFNYHCKYDSGNCIYIIESYGMDLKSIPKGILFLDRDGVVIHEKNYLKDPEDVNLIPGAAEAIRQANKGGWIVSIVTNQAGIARGLFGWEEYLQVTKKMFLQLSQEAAHIDIVIACPLHPDGVIPDFKRKGHEMRKPGPGMLNHVMNRFRGIKISSVLVGDKICDILAGKQAQVECLVHVKTGHGERHRQAIVQECKATGLDVLLIDSIAQLPPIQSLTRHNSE